MSGSFMILDCYVDEPACFGVPPFVSPYPRYVYGALIAAGVDGGKILYRTIDDLRKTGYLIEENTGMIFLLGGAVVPGKYLGYSIATQKEVLEICNKNSASRFAIGYPMSARIQNPPDNVMTINGDIELFAYTFAKGMPQDDFRSVRDISVWSKAGAPVIKKHPEYPDLICEIETFRGCPRLSHCSFCSEGTREKLQHRSVNDILSETDALIDQGISRFRIGRQADILQYNTHFDEFRAGFPKPEVKALKELFTELRQRRDRGLITVLNIDNANPGTIANFPEESAEILETIVSALTPGDTLPLGIESVDPQVIKKNNLKVSAEQGMDAVRMINEIGGSRINGVPILLPGINLIHGLSGESAETFKMNYLWLQQILDNDLLLRRINIRVLMPFPGTALESPPGISKTVRNRFEYYREKIRREIDVPMLKKIYPPGTILKDVFTLDTHGGYTYGKQIASYPITVRIPGSFKLRKKTDVVITGNRERSLNGLLLPVNLNDLDHRSLESIPGISSKTATDIILRRPLNDIEQIRDLLCQVPEPIHRLINP